MIRETVLKWGVTVACAAVLTAISGFVRKLWKQEKATRTGLQSLLRVEIIRSYEKYMERGHCPIYAREALEQIYDSYRSLGQNGTMGELMKQLRELPTKPPPK